MTKLKYKSNLNISYSCKYHVVWCTKYRKRILSFDIQKELKHILETTCLDARCELFSIETMEDHVHILVEADPQFGIHRLVKSLKGKSSKILREKYKALRTRVPTLWTNSYFVSTVGGAPLSIVKQYIENQKNR